MNALRHATKLGVARRGICRVQRRGLSAGRIRAEGRGAISTNKAPTPIGHYSQAIKINNTIYVGGQLGLVPGKSGLISEDPAEQAEQAMKNMGAILEAAGATFDNVVKTSLLLSNMDDFKAVNEVYGKYFKGDPPARVAYAVQTLPLNSKVEIDAIAVLE